MQIISVRLTDNISEVRVNALGELFYTGVWSPKQYTYIDLLDCKIGDVVLAGVYNKITYGIVTKIQRPATIDDTLFHDLKPIYAKIDEPKLQALFLLRHRQWRKEHTPIEDPKVTAFRELLEEVGPLADIFLPLVPPKPKRGKR